MLKMGGMEGVMGMMPGMGKMQKQMAEAGFDDKVIRHQIALINSMTRIERANPQILQASRKKRIAAGSGLEVSELNKLLKMQRQMADMMKKLGRGGAKGMMRQMAGLFGKGGMPQDPAAIEAAARQLGNVPGGALPPGLSGFGKK
jgi:signal recognition particle subunit SRP54